MIQGSIRVVKYGTPKNEKVDLPSKSNNNKTIDYKILYLKNQENDVEIKEAITAQYTYDYNILELDSIIMKRFNLNKEKQIKEFDDKITLLDFKIKAGNMNGIGIKKMRISKDEYLAKIKDIQEDKSKREYIERTKELIAIYKNLGPKNIVRKFNDSGKKKVLTEDEKKEEELRLFVIERYLNIAKDYIPLNILRKVEKTNLCEGCGIELIDELREELDGFIRCINCGTEVVSFIHQSDIGESKETKISSKTSYEDRETFYKFILKYQGKQKNKLPDDILTKLDEYFVGLGFPSGEEVRKQPPDRKGRKKGTSLNMLLKALSKKGLENYYEDANLIGSLYWGWVLPDLSKYEEQLLYDYDRLQAVYKKIKKPGKSSLNVQYRLYKQLEILGLVDETDKCNFKLAKSEKTLEQAEKMFKIMCEQCEGPPIIFKPLK